MVHFKMQKGDLSLPGPIPALQQKFFKILSNAEEKTTGNLLRSTGFELKVNH